MTKVSAGITTSLDGYIAGPNDGPGREADPAHSGVRNDGLISRRPSSGCGRVLR